jgi:hypothetical protein
MNTSTRLIHEGLMQTLAPDGEAVRGPHTQLRKRLPLVARRQDSSYE